MVHRFGPEANHISLALLEPGEGMASSPANFSFLRRQRLQSPESFLAPAGLTDDDLLHAVAAVSTDLIASYSDKSLAFQRSNSRSLIRKVEVLGVMLESLRDSGSASTTRLSPTATLCFKELYQVLYRSKMLLDYCAQSSRIWLVLQNPSISGLFHDRTQEISALLDVFPLEELELELGLKLDSADVREQVELLRAQSRRAGGRLYVDERDEALRLKLFQLLGDLEAGGVLPDPADLKSLFVDGLGIRDAKRCRAEMEFLEEAVCNNEGDLEPTASVLNGFVALARYCRFLLFGFEEEEELGLGFDEITVGNKNDDDDNHHYKKKKKKKKKKYNSTTTMPPIIPKDFCCPVTLDLMRDPVIICTGQSYDRGSITRWMDEGHCTCPKTGQSLLHTRVVPNRALRSLIFQWCTAHGIPFDPLDCADASAEAFASSPPPTKAAAAVNRATTGLLVGQLAAGSGVGKSAAVREIRLLAKTGKENRGYIAEAGAIPHLRSVLSSSDAVAQANSVTAMLNLSIHDRNKRRIMEEGCLEKIVEVLRFGLGTEAKENAAATLFSLSSVHGHKQRIADAEGTVEGLTELLKSGTPRGKKDAVTALFNLSTHTANCARLVEGGAVAALVGALAVEGVAEEAAGTLGLLVRLPIGSAAVAEEEEEAVAGLIRMMRSGSPRAKENAVAAILELCRSGGAATTERVLRAPALLGLLQQLLFKGTKRARRKAASLARHFYRWDKTAAFHFGGLGAGYAFAGDSTAAAASRDSSYSVDDDPVWRMALSVHVA